MPAVRKFPSRRPALRAVMAALLASTPAAAWAQQQPPGEVVELPPVNVTGAKRATDPMRVDATSLTVDSETLAARDLRTVDQLDRAFPDLHIRPRSSRTYSNATMRGQTSSDFYAPSVQTLVDGLPQDFALFGQLLPLQVDRVEALYGPQGTLYGANAVGGVLNVVTRRPDNELRMGGTLGYSNRQKDAGVLLSTPLVKDTLYGDVALNWREQRGAYRAPDGSDDFGSSRDKTGQLRLRYAPTGGPWDIMASAGRAILSSSEEQFVLASQLDSRQAFPLPSYYRMTTTSLGLNASYDFGGLSLTSITGYQDRDLDRTVFGSYTPEKQRTVSQEIRLASTGKRRVDYVAGLYYQNVDFQRDIPGQVSTQDIDSYAAFGELTWHVTDRLDLTPGLRLDRINTDAAASGFVALNAKRDDTALSPKLALGYQLTDEVRLFGLYSSGFKSGGFTRTVTPANFAFEFSPARTDNVEAGVRGKLFGGAAEISASAYYAYTRDYQTFVGAQPYQYLQNTGDVESYGFDASLRAFLGRGWRISAGLGLNHAEFVKYRDPTGLGQNYSGNRPAYAPAVTGNLDVAYTITLPGTLGELTPRAGLTYVGRTWYDEANTVGQSAYTLVDAGLTWAITQHLSTTLYGNNLTDKRYTTYGFNQPGLGTFYQLGYGRELGVRLTASF